MTVRIDSGPVHALLTDGSIVRIRPAAVGDAAAVHRLHQALSAENRRLRFFVPGPRVPGHVAERLCRPPDPAHAALVALLAGEIVGIAGYERDNGAATAEISLAVAEHVHGRGVGTLLLEHLASLARRGGVAALTAEVLLDNHAMLRVFADAGLPLRRHLDMGVVEVELPLTMDDRYLSAVEERESRAGLASMHRLLRPSSLAVVGGTRRAVSVGNAVVRNILEGGYTGRVHLVHPGEADVAGIAAHPSAADLPEPPDLVVVAVPAEAVPDVARACGERGAGALAVLSAGLAASARRELLEICRAYEMRLLGPNCFGLANLDPDVRLHATFAARRPRPGHACVITQSGGVGITLMEHLSRLGIGVSTFASVGDRLDVSSNDLLAWAEADAGTRMAVVHVESFGNPRKFSRIARRISRKLPVLAMLSGRSAAGRRAARTHTGGAAVAELTGAALFRQAGVSPVRSVTEMVETAAVLAHQPLPAGPRVAVVTNTAGTGVLVADACEAEELEVPTLGTDLRRKLAGDLPPGGSCANPVDTTPQVRTEQLRCCVRALAESPEVDAIILVLVPTALADLAPTLCADTGGKPILAVAPEQPEAVTVLPGGDRGVPTFSAPEEAAAALGQAWARTRWLARPAGTVPVFPDAAVGRAREEVREFLRTRPVGGWLPLDAALRVAECYGIRTAPWRRARSAEEAVAALDVLGGRVAVKGDVAGLAHRRAAGALRLDLDRPEEVRAAYRACAERFPTVVVQAMAAREFDTRLGIIHQPVFGPLVLFGLGGSYADALDTRSARLTPLTDVDAAELVREVRAVAALGAEGGDRRMDVPAVQEVAARLSQLAGDLPEVAEMDLNPVSVGEHGALALDARVRVSQRPDEDPYLRALPPF
ncbi:bifunctional acetate--CoA ligase family protein/GNAT family N-acetyltransferase [Marinitenerispora sediminis]|uniref:bifunctional acetate--CoA ligase family protein/GNAT family N-acetyltransferase n=1 Tax=Marinitenerispora sediminis TaxID=1931232 RepID=UPI000DF27316|nr:GNAT family N-acetyltransferase [Marinitenerispora sediminis]RCV57960.1 GNAT family N-acetyltransferase [Marinitenerispora sediminis]RCV62307.1 GNAT family N-acetyltransferase [Marinitenerispora sediminis]